MAKFLTTRSVSAELENIINNAKDWLFLISPYLDIPDTLLECIKSADNRKVKTILIYGKKERQDEALSRLAQFGYISVRYLENLHAKCYFNQESMVITSMNLLSYSEVNNREMGILVNRVEEPAIFNDAHNEVLRILEHSIEVQIKGAAAAKRLTPVDHTARRSEAVTDRGFCIKCGKSIDYNPMHPYCPDCFRVWKRWNNPDYPASVCHRCGRQSGTTMNNPICLLCNANSLAAFVKGIFK